MIAGVDGKKKRGKRSAAKADAAVAQNCYPAGELRIAFDSAGDDFQLLVSIVSNDDDGQTKCREEFAKATGEPVVGPMPPTLGKRKAGKSEARKRPNTTDVTE
jgi:hypothetical protein